MKKIIFYTLVLIIGGISYSCGDQCIKCESVNGYPNSVVCKDTYETTTNNQSASWADYQKDAVDAGCVKQ